MTFNIPTPGNPNIRPSDFPLGRKLNVAANGYACVLNATAAGTPTGILVTPNTTAPTQPIIVVGYQIDASVATRFNVQFATGLTGGFSTQPVNMMSTGVNSGTFTVLTSSTGPLTGATPIASLDLPAAQAYPYVDLSNNPIILVDNITGFGINTPAITGTVRVTIFIQTYPY